ncbi:MAG: hypothetical protein J4N69_09615, partial [Chloroflexi bacterium]|nr:hypothetical protein [Chloroflexota bacterium]
NLAQNTAIDARVKTNIVHRQYCGLAVREYLTYLLSDEARWSNWLAANVDPNDPSGATSTETVDPCGESITITVVQEPVLPPAPGDDPLKGLVLIPQLSEFEDREFQVIKTVSDTNPNGGDPVTYTIMIVNRDDTALDLKKIEDELPIGFAFDCNAAPNQLTLPNTAAQDFPPKDRVDLCPESDGIDIEWVLPDNTSIAPGEIVTLTFGVVTDSSDGNYCNRAQVAPGGDTTSNGKTAPVQIGANPGPCTGDAVVVTKSLDSATLVSTNTSTIPYTYTFDIDFTIKIDNVGTQDLPIEELRDWLPVGFSYVSTSPSGDITDIPDEVLMITQVNRERITWEPDPAVELNSGQSKTLKYSTTAAITRGNYYSDLLVSFGAGSFGDERYTWPTALVSVKDVYTVSATDEAGDEVVIALQVWVGGEDGVVNTWSLQ